MSEFKDKKLLILGANPETGAIVEVANKMGVYTIITDYNPLAPAKRLACKSYNVDCLDVPALVDLAQNERVDGILVGVADVLLPAYQQVCQILNLPCYCTKEEVAVFSNKYNFKRTCEKYGIRGIPEYHLDNEFRESGQANIRYPVLVKPVDNCSGKGMTVCYTDGELQMAIEKALSFSRGKKILVERFMTCDDFIIYYTFKDGYYSVSMLGDRFTCSEQNGVSPVCLADIYPSKHTKLYFELMHNQACRMFKDLGVKNGVFLIQAFVENGEIYVYDPGFRLQGGAQHLVMNAVNGFDQRKMLIEFALTGSMGAVDLQKEDDYMLRGKTAGSLWLLLKEGTIGTIEGLENLENDSRIINVLQRFTVGDVITSEMIGTEQQVFARLHIVCDSRDRYKETILELQKKVKVFDLEGNNMIIPGVNVSLL